MTTPIDWRAEVEELREDLKVALGDHDEEKKAMAAEAAAHLATFTAQALAGDQRAVRALEHLRAVSANLADETKERIEDRVGNWMFTLILRLMRGAMA